MEIFDQLNRKLVLKETPQRIVSLVPSQTELLFDLGLGERVVGLTKFCVHPEEALRTKTMVGGTKQHRFELFDELKPDLIIANKEENAKENIDRLIEKYPVYVSDVCDLTTALGMIEDLGKIGACSEIARKLCNEILEKIGELEISKEAKPRVLYLIWQDPYMAAGSDTFINTALELAGYRNAISATRYPKLSLKDIEILNPDFVFFSSEPFPFAEKHMKVFDSAFEGAQLELVDGEMFSWYGSRLLKAFDYWKALSDKLNSPSA